MKWGTIVCLALAVSATAAGEKQIELRLADPQLCTIFKGLTQAGEKTQSLEIRELFAANKGSSELVRGGVYFYVVFDPDRDTFFWAPKILKEVYGFDPVMRRLSSDTIIIDFHSGAHTHLRQTWRLPNGKQPMLEKEEAVE